MVKLLPLYFNKAEYFGKVIAVTGFVENKCSKQANFSFFFFFFPKCAVISENNEIESRFARRDSFLDIRMPLNSSAVCEMQPPKPVILSDGDSTKVTFGYQFYKRISIHCVAVDNSTKYMIFLLSVMVKSVVESSMLCWIWQMIGIFYLIIR